MILLSDLRLCSKKNADDISKTFSCNKINAYNFFHNSTKNKRGVGILISSKLDYTCLEEYRDIDENILALKISMKTVGFGWWRSMALTIMMLIFFAI
jgi:hypothetical protein